MRSDGANTWEMIVTKGYKLPCKKVFHVILGGYDKNKRKMCLQVVDLSVICITRADSSFIYLLHSCMWLHLCQKAYLYNKGYNLTYFVELACCET